MQKPLYSLLHRNDHEHISSIIQENDSLIKSPGCIFDTYVGISQAEPIKFHTCRDQYKCQTDGDSQSMKHAITHLVAKCLQRY